MIREFKRRHKISQWLNSAQCYLKQVVNMLIQKELIKSSMQLDVSAWMIIMHIRAISNATNVR